MSVCDDKLQHISIKSPPTQHRMPYTKYVWRSLSTLTHTHTRRQQWVNEFNLNVVEFEKFYDFFFQIFTSIAVFLDYVIYLWISHNAKDQCFNKNYLLNSMTREIERKKNYESEQFLCSILSLHVIVLDTPYTCIHSTIVCGKGEARKT